MTSVFAFLGFLALSFVVATSGAIFKPGEWYRRLDKPSWTPPSWAFPVVWAFLYVMMSVSGWLVWREVGLTTVFVPYGAQLLFNGMWSWLFFGRRRPDQAFADLVLLWVAVAATIVAFSTVSTLAAWLLVPYLAWVTTAGCLNWSVWRRNQSAFAGSA